MAGAAAFMLQGTASGVGKSVLTAAFCRAVARRGLRVMPFKPQNMANNAAVASDGGEIGRSQHLQALAAGVSPSHHMNPVLIKPQGSSRSQVVVQGKVWAVSSAREYWRARHQLMPLVLQSFAHCCSNSDIVIVEGAGSASEVNLREGDIANMGFAAATDIPVVIAADIGRGGVIASLVGTAEVLSTDDRARVHGYIINRFAGDPSLFCEGERIITDKTSWSCLGIVPEAAAARLLPPEDSMHDVSSPRCDNVCDEATREPVLVAVPRLRFASNLEDIDPLRFDQRCRVVSVEAGESIPRHADAVILTGSKDTRAELDYLRINRWDEQLRAYRFLGGNILGICGGYQMLGEQVEDIAGVDGSVGSSAGLGMLRLRTALSGEKITRERAARHRGTGAAVKGYEIRVGRVSGADCRANPLFVDDEGIAEGAVSVDGLVIGTAIHGTLSDAQFRTWWLRRVSGKRELASDGDGASHHERVERALDAMADVVEQAVDMERLLEIASA